VNGHDPTGTQDFLEFTMLTAVFMPSAPVMAGMAADLECIASLALSKLLGPAAMMVGVKGCLAMFADTRKPGGGGGGSGGGPGKKPCPCSFSAQTLESYMLNTIAYGADRLPIPSTTAARPLAAYASTIMADGVADNVDPRLIVAIGYAETKFGALNCAGVPNTKNPFCIGDMNPHPYQSIDNAIKNVANYLGGLIVPTTTVADLYKPKTGLYCNTGKCDPVVVNYHLTRQGGGVGLPGVYGPLQSPCYLGQDGNYYQKEKQ
jgi:hypothetical protein